MCCMALEEGPFSVLQACMPHGAAACCDGCMLLVGTLACHFKLTDLKSSPLSVRACCCMLTEAELASWLACRLLADAPVTCSGCPNTLGMVVCPRPSDSISPQLLPCTQREGATACCAAGMDIMSGDCPAELSLPHGWLGADGVAADGAAVPGTGCNRVCSAAGPDLLRGRQAGGAVSQRLRRTGCLLRRAVCGVCVRRRLLLAATVPGESVHLATRQGAIGSSQSAAPCAMTAWWLRGFEYMPEPCMDPEGVLGEDKAASLASRAF